MGISILFPPEVLLVSYIYLNLTYKLIDFRFFVLIILNYLIRIFQHERHQ